jgi:hypothetical protein
VSARLFRSIRPTFSSLKKTFFIIAIFLGVTLFHTTPALAILQTDIDTNYSGWFNLFDSTSGIIGSNIQNSTSSNDAAGLVLSLQLNAGRSASGVSNWSNTNIANDTINNNEKFIVKLCLDDSPTQCWLSSVPSSKDKTLKPNTITMVSAQGNIVDTPETVTVTAFSQTAPKGTLYQYDPTINDINPLGGLVLKKGSSMTASLWYCANGRGANAVDEYNANNFHPANPTRFGTLCGGNSFFQIGNTTTKVVIPVSSTEIQEQAQAGQDALAQNTVATATSTKDDNLPKCVFSFSSGGTINGCAAQLAYGLFYVVSWIAGILGKLFDFFMGYSVSDQSYRYTFAVTGWRLVRDISNIFFIIIMVYTGFSAVFDTSKNNMKSVVPNLIINALLINFSLFATRVVIDLSNITARMFYSQMIVCEKVDIDPTTGKCPAIKAKRGTGGYWPLSEKIVSSFNPQLMFKADILQPQNISSAASDTATFNGQSAGTVSSSLSERDYANYFLVVCLIATIIMAGIGTMFFKVAFLFLGRVIGLYICMIFAPFAFLSRQMPLLGSVQTLRWNDWKSELTNYALLAPIFTFFLYIIYTFLSSNFVSEIGFVDTTGDFFGTVLSIVIPMLIIYFMIDAAQKAAQKYAGSIGNSVQKYGEMATGLVAGAAIGVATGGASLMGTSAAGAFKLSGATRTDLENRKAAGGFSGMTAGMRLKASDWTQKQTFDARNTGAMQTLSKKFGFNANNKLVNTLGFGSDRTKGGRDGQIKRAEDSTTKRINEIKSHLSDSEAEEYWNKHVNSKKMQKRIEKEAQALYLEKYKTTVTDKNSAEFLAEKQNAIKAYGTVKNNKQLTQALRVQYAGTIQNENILGINPEGNIATTLGVGAARIVTGITGAGVTAGAGVVGGGLLAGAATDNVGKRKAAKAFLDNQKKAVSKKPRKEKLTEETEGLKKELTGIESAFEKGYREAAKAEVESSAEHSGKAQAEKDAIVKERVEFLKNKDNAAEAATAINKYKEQLQNQYDILDMDVKRINEEYEAAIKNGNTILASAKEKDRYAAVASRNKAKSAQNELDAKRKRDIENSINRNEGELEKISDKEKSSEKGDSDKPKDDKK